MRAGSRECTTLESAKTLAWVASRGLAGVQVAGRHSAQLVARADVELLKDLPQVVLHRARADEELSADLRVGEAVSCQPGDVRLLRGEHGTRVVGALPRGLARREELVANALGELG